MLVDIVAEQHQRGRVLQRRRLSDVACARRFDRDDRLDLVRALLRDLEAERAALAVQQQHAGADLVHQREVGVDDRLVGGEPARHRLLHVIVVGLHRELVSGQHLALGRISVPRALAVADAEALERVRVVQKNRLGRPHVRTRKARAAALDRVGDVDVPALADEQVEPTFAAVRRGFVGHAGETAAVPHQQRQLALAVPGQKVLHVHLLDHELPVGVEFRRRAAGDPHDLPHRPATDLGDASADVERAHAAQHDVVLARARRQGRERKDRGDQHTTHAVPPRLVLPAMVMAAVTPRAAPARPFA